VAGKAGTGLKRGNAANDGAIAAEGIGAVGLVIPG